MITNREKGKCLENMVSALLEHLDKYVRPSKASGACNEIGDISNNLKLKIECKYRNTINSKIDKKVWNKLYSSLPSFEHTPVLMLQDKEEDIFAVLGINDFIRILGGFLENEKRK